MTTCQKCGGCGQIANDEDGTPWTFWAELPPGSDMAVVMGVVYPITCPECNGKVKVAECPLCEWVLEGQAPQPVPRSLSAVFGMSPETMFGVHQDQARNRWELDLFAHLGTHSAREWFPALMKARQDLAAHSTVPIFPDNHFTQIPKGTGS